MTMVIVTMWFVVRFGIRLNQSAILIRRELRQFPYERH